MTSLKTLDKILVIEDNHGDFLLIQEYLAEENLFPQIIQAKTFKEAKKILTEQSGFDVILLDLTLPDAKGEQLVQDIVDSSNRIPVIIFTGYADRDFGIKSLSLGVSDYLLKDELNAFYLTKSIAYSIQRIKIANQLKKSEENYRNLFQLSPQPMWVHALDTYQFLHVNNAAILHYGFSEKEFLKMSVKDICLIENEKLFDEIHRETETSQKKHIPQIIRHQKKNGKVIFVDIQSAFIEFDGKKAKLLLATDITEKLMAEGKLLKSEEALRKLNAELEERVASRTAELKEVNKQLETFTYSVSHDLQAPARNILSFAQILQMEAKDSLSDRGEEFLANIMQNSVKMQDIIKNLLNFFRLGQKNVEKQKVDTNIIVNGICNEFQTQQPGKIIFNIHPLPEVYADKNMMNHVFFNYLGNAVKYSSKKDKQQIEVGTLQENSKIIFYVKDNGAGFDMKYAGKLFNLFQRLHSASQFDGTGLGLAIVKEIIEKHGGEVWAESKPDEGAVFYFSLPTGN